MKTTLSLNLIIFFAAFLPGTLSAQGCSDAGACTMGSFQHHQSSELEQRNIRLSFGSSVGSADRSIFTVSNFLTYSHQLGQKLSVEARLTSISQSGNSISEFGLSDFFTSASYKVTDQLNLNLGAKFPLSDGNAKKDGLSLPMDYQSSLGTVDLIVGVGINLDNFQVALALQQPLSQNSNEFLAENYPTESSLSKFQSTKEFERSGDLILRLSYPITLNDALVLTPSLLPVYHLSNDSFTDSKGNKLDIEGSQGLRLNTNVFLDYQLSSTYTMRLNAALPLMVRDERPEGLTRGFVAGLSFSYRL